MALTHAEQDNNNAVKDCTDQWGITKESLRGKNELVDALQRTPTAEQAPQAQQAANIASCINNLAKLNPIIREKITVLSVQIGTTNLSNGLLPKAALAFHYIFEIFVLTNEPEKAFRGRLKCAKSFGLLQDPYIQPYAQLTMMGGTTSRRLGQMNTTYQSTTRQPNGTRRTLLICRY